LITYRILPLLLKHTIKFTLVRPVQYLYVYGPRRLLGENNVKLTNKINIDGKN